MVQGQVGHGDGVIWAIGVYKNEETSENHELRTEDLIYSIWLFIIFGPEVDLKQPPYAT